MIESDYPADTLAEARRSAIKCALDANRGAISYEHYQYLSDFLHRRIDELAKAEIEQLKRGKP